MTRYIVTLAVLISVFVARGAAASDFEVTVPGYTGKVDVQEPKGEAKAVIVISLHGKGKGRGHPGNVKFAKKLSKAGYVVYRPDMPWNGYKASLPVAFEFLDALVRRVAEDGERVVIAGHSQGAVFGYLYTVAHEPPPSVVGTIILAPGHIPHRSLKMQSATADSLLRARKMIADGEGDEMATFKDMNQGKSFSIRTTPNIYVTYFDLGTTPNFISSLKEARLPLLWVDGASDRLSQLWGYEVLYETFIPPRDENRYTTVSGDHVYMWWNAHKPVVKWLEKLETVDLPDG
jgi:dienelactone hydrolase